MHVHLGLTALGGCDGAPHCPGGGGGGVCSVTTHSSAPGGSQELAAHPQPRRRAEDKDEGIGSPDIWEDEKAEDLRREMIGRCGSNWTRGAQCA